MHFRPRLISFLASGGYIAFAVENSAVHEFKKRRHAAATTTQSIQVIALQKDPRDGPPPLVTGPASWSQTVSVFCIVIWRRNVDDRRRHGRSNFCDILVVHGQCYSLFRFGGHQWRIDDTQGAYGAYAVRKNI